MLCKNCEHFRIECDPQIIGGECWDFGRATCSKYNLVTEFRTRHKFETLSCVEDNYEDDRRESGLIAED